MRPQAADEGFTLIDTLIAVVIMGTTIVALVTAMSGVVVTTQYHRGNAVAEDVTHNAVEAIAERLSIKTTLTAVASATSTTLQVQNGTSFAGFAYVNVDDEMMKVTAAGASSITVTRVASNTNTHASGAIVVPAFRCPLAGELRPVSAGWAPPGVTADITSVEYWDPAAAAGFVALATCGTSYDNRCLNADGAAGDLRAECDLGLERITLSISTSGDSRYKAVTATTQALVRRGSP